MLSFKFKKSGLAGKIQRKTAVVLIAFAVLAAIVLGQALGAVPILLLGVLLFFEKKLSNTLSSGIMLFALITATLHAQFDLFFWAFLGATMVVSYNTAVLWQE